MIAVRNRSCGRVDAVAMVIEVRRGSLVEAATERGAVRVVDPARIRGQEWHHVVKDDGGLPPLEKTALDSYADSSASSTSGEGRCSSSWMSAGPSGRNLDGEGRIRVAGGNPQPASEPFQKK